MKFMIRRWVMDRERSAGRELAPRGNGSARWRRVTALVCAGLVAAVSIGCGGEWGASDTDAQHVARTDHAAHDLSAANHDLHAANDVHAAHDAHASHGAGEPLGEPTDFSLYHLDAPWLDQHGQERQLASLGGRIQVVAMVYTQCSYACPRIMLDMKRIEGELAPELRDRVGFVIVSIDPERDTPERLASYAKALHLDPESWTLLTAPDNTVLELAALLGVKYRRISETDFSHTNVITVLDQQGEIAHRQVGLGADPRGTLSVINRLAREGA